MNIITGNDNNEQDNDTIIQQWKIKKMIASLEAAKGSGTSMISLILPPKEQLAKINQKLVDEYGTASNIKSRVNRQSVLNAITSTQNRLKLYNKVPTNGLVIYCGTILTDEGKEKMINIDFEPFKPINTSLYLCDNKFHVEALRALLQDDNKFGFVIMDGSGTLFATLTGNTKNIIHHINVDLPKKHGRGGQSAMRFARLRLEKRHNYVRKVAELCTQIFITNDRPNVSGLILAGSADFKSELSTTLLDPRLQKIVLKIVDVSYGGENGFNQAIDLSAEVLGNVKFVHEKKILQQFMEEIAIDTGKFCFGVHETMHALEMGSIETLIVWENLEYVRYILSDEKIKYIHKSKQTDAQQFQDLQIINQESLLEYLIDNYQKFGARIEIVTSSTQEGNQFCQGFGGIGGLLRYKLDLNVYDQEQEENKQNNNEKEYEKSTGNLLDDLEFLL